MGSFFPPSDGSKSAVKFFPLSKETEDAVNFLAENLKNLKFDGNGEMEEERSKKIDDARKMLDEMKRSIEGTTQQPEKEISKISSSSSVQPPRLLKKRSEMAREADLLEGQMVANLQLSYDLLPVKLRLCSLFLAVFPENAIIEKKYLIYWWIGEGFITKTSTMTSEDAGEAAFKELIEKGIIEPHYRSLRSPVVSGCTVNPWTRRMLISMARKAVFFDFDLEGELRYSSQISHRAIKDQIDSSEEGELLTMYNMWGSYHRINPEFLSKIQKLRVLQLGRWQKNARRHIEIEDTKFLDKLSTQKQLKYLSLRGISRITTLPESIIGCQNLEILDLRACHNLEKLPSEIGSLRKLTHFIVSECYLLEGLPKGLEKISSLEVIKGFVVNHWRKNPCPVSSLYELEKLRKLSISVGTSSKQERAPNPNKRSSSFAVQEVPSLNQPFALGGIFTGYAFPKELRAENLRVLTIIWQMRSSTDKKEEEEEEEESTAPFVSVSLPMLEKMDLRCYPRKRLPQWILPANFRNLKRLYIRGGKLETLLPLSTSDAKWEIQILRLNYLKNFHLRQTFDMEKEFPKLLYFERTKCHHFTDGKFDADIEWRLEDEWKTLKETLECDHRDRLPQRIQTRVAATEEQEEEEEEEDGGEGGGEGGGRKKMEDEDKKRRKKEGEEDKKRKEEGSSKKGKEEEEGTSRKGKEGGGGGE